MSTGRLDLDEYGDRSARITEAKTRGELAEVFADLPRPHPRLDDKFAVAPQAPRRTAFWADWEPAQRIAVAALTLTWLIAVALLLATGEFWWVLLPIPLTGEACRRWGNDGKFDWLHTLDSDRKHTWEDGGEWEKRLADRQARDRPRRGDWDRLGD
jgi:hypothetical protein